MCWKSTPTGPCQRPVSRPGAPCGVAHAALVSAGVDGAAAAAAAAGPGADPLSAPPAHLGEADLDLGDPDRLGYRPVRIPRAGLSDAAARQLVGRRVSIGLYTTGVMTVVKDVRDGAVIYDSMEQSPFSGIGGSELVERGVRFRDMMHISVADG